MIVAYVATLIAFAGIDSVWLGLMAQRVYRPAIGDLLAAKFDLPPAIAFYLLFPVGLTLFVVAPAVKSHSLGDAALYGALFSFFAYATYDLTNQATLRSWPTHLSLIDMAWGFTLGGLASTVGWLVAHRFASA
jgi:uncharacterized membrane protein